MSLIFVYYVGTRKNAANVLSSSDDKSQSLFRTTCTLTTYTHLSTHWLTNSLTDWLTDLVGPLARQSPSAPNARVLRSTSSDKLIKHVIRVFVPSSCLPRKSSSARFKCYVGEIDDATHLLNQFSCPKYTAQDHNRAIAVHRVDVSITLLSSSFFSSPTEREKGDKLDNNKQWKNYRNVLPLSNDEHTCGIYCMCRIFSAVCAPPLLISILVSAVLFCFLPLFCFVWCLFDRITAMSLFGLRLPPFTYTALPT